MGIENERGDLSRMLNENVRATSMTIFALDLSRNMNDDEAVDQSLDALEIQIEEAQGIIAEMKVTQG